MPHITLEYSNNITNTDFRAIFQELKDRIVATGEAQELGVKCRAVASTDYFIVNGNENYKMVNLLFRMREGRSLEVRIEAKEVILSTEVKELMKDLDLLKNSIR
jgi:5-carboxymethyl-2-hydroxymuconate isomerase